MLSKIDDIGWSRGDLTGGGAFVSHDNSIFVVSSLRNPTPEDSDFHFAIFQSTDQGRTWSKIVSRILPLTAFSEPQIAYDPSGMIFILTSGGRSDGMTDLLLFSFDLTVLALSEPVTVLTARKFRPSYAVCFDEVASEVIVAAMSIGSESPSVYAGITGVIESVFTPALELVRESVVENVTNTNFTYGGIQLVSSQDQIYLYCIKRNKKYQLKATPSVIEVRSRLHGSLIYNPSSEVLQYSSEFNDDKLTVVAQGTSHYLSTMWWEEETFIENQRLTSRIKYNLRVGVWDGVVWDWLTLPSSRLTEPTLSISEAGLISIAYLDRDPKLVGDGLLRVIAWDRVNGLVSNMDRGIRNERFLYLRGSLVPPSSNWEFLGVTLEGIPYFISSLNLPPELNYTITPSGGLKRECPIVINANSSTDSDRDDLEFTWSITPATNVTMVTSGSSATITALKSWGPSGGIITVHLRLRDLDVDNNPIHEVSTDIPLMVLPDAKPSVLWRENPIYCNRENNVILRPVISDLEQAPLSLLWEQVSGSPCPFNNGDSNSVLDIDTSQIRVLGETLRFKLTVSDGVNLPLVSIVDVVVPPIRLTDKLLDKHFIHKSYWMTDEQAVVEEEIQVFIDSPVADGLEFGSGTFPVLTTFTGRGESNYPGRLIYHWEFDDNSSAEGNIVVKSWDWPLTLSSISGDYSTRVVTLTVTNSFTGKSGSLSRVLQIIQPE
jgi:hypothetical protein